MFFFDGDEQDLVASVLVLVGPDAQTALVASLAWLARVAREVIHCPPWASPASSDAAALVDHLGTVSDHDVGLHIPTKAVLGQAYLVAKINFIKELTSVARRAGLPADVISRCEFELGQSIYSRLAEELFLSIVVDGSTPPRVVQAAARLLHQIWESRLLTEVDDFAPLLEAAWEARNQVRPVLGTMLGSHEIFRLFQAARDDRFLDHFSDDDISPEQTEAFEEFLFDLSYEEIARLRAHMHEHHQAAVSVDDATAILGRAPVLAAAETGPGAVYASYKNRKVKATYRALTGAHGPKHTAEEYVMLAYLSRNESVTRERISSPSGS
jgi:hypothetical protein